MKRLLIVLVACTVLGLAVGVGTASADLLSAPAAGVAPNLVPATPVDGGGGSSGQSADFGDQSNTQKNYANPVVTNVGPANVSPTTQATVWGNNTNKTEQNGSGNTNVGIAQSNKNENEQSNTQTQSQGSGSCCQPKKDCCSSKDSVDNQGGQSASFGDQSNYQKNQANPVVTNVGPTNVSPTVQATVWGDNTNKTEQNGSGNTNVGIAQSNKNENEQTNTQNQSQGSGRCCDSNGRQSAEFGNQENKQKNYANPVVTNVGPTNVSPTVQATVFGNNSNEVEQNHSGNTNVGIVQSNRNENEQTNTQSQSQGSGKGCCGSGPHQSVWFGDQSNTQKNYANPLITNTGPANVSPTSQTSLGSICGACGGNNTNKVEQNHSGNTNLGIVQSNRNENEQTNDQSQSVTGRGGDFWKNSCCGGEADQSAHFGDQSNYQKNQANPVITNIGPANVSPTAQWTMFGNNSNSVEQNHSGNTNVGIVQSNSNENEQTNTQRQSVDGGGPCCHPRCERKDCEPNACEPKPRCEPKRCEPEECKPKRCEPKQCEPKCGENTCTSHKGFDTLRF